MRTIEFRAWDMQLNKYHMHAERTHDTLEKGYVVDCFGDLVREQDRYAIEQYTGMDDSAGVKIFDGDVVEDSRGGIYLIKWDAYNMMFQAVNLEDFSIDALGSFRNKPKLKKIGNIHQKRMEKYLHDA